MEQKKFMKIQATRIVIKAFAVFIFLLLLGCATPRSGGPVPDKGLLDFLEDGKTTKQMVFEKLGQPSGTYENGRILTYRIGNEEGEGYYIIGAGPSQTMLFIKSKYSLVLIFNDVGILERHSLVSVR
jgi:hypothetical protein